jgi:hypothetical protein
MSTEGVVLLVLIRQLAEKWGYRSKRLKFLRNIIFDAFATDFVGRLCFCWVKCNSVVSFYGFIKKKSRPGGQLNHYANENIIYLP